MAERDADRARPERMCGQAVQVFTSVADREISPGFRQRLTEYSAAPDLFGPVDLLASAQTGLEAQIARNVADGNDAADAISDALRRLGESYATRPVGRHGHHGCGVCGGCLLRTVSANAAGLSQDRGTNAFDGCALEDKVRRQDGRDQSMTPGERAVAVRAIAAMAEFASLAGVPKGRSAVDCEARLIDPDRPEKALAGLTRLLQRHQFEWNSFVDVLQQQSWVRQVVGQL